MRSRSEFISKQKGEVNNCTSKQTGLSSLFASFGYAFNGLKYFGFHERNGKIQLLAAVITVILGSLFHISSYEWICVVACIATVLSFEMINTAIEKICNLIDPNYNLLIRVIKDIAAGAVLIVATASAIIGAIIFLPKIVSII